MGDPLANVGLSDLRQREMDWFSFAKPRGESCHRVGSMQSLSSPPDVCELCSPFSLRHYFFISLNMSLGSMSSTSGCNCSATQYTIYPDVGVTTITTLEWSSSAQRHRHLDRFGTPNLQGPGHLCTFIPTHLVPFIPSPSLSISPRAIPRKGLIWHPCHLILVQLRPHFIGSPAQSAQF